MTHPTGLSAPLVVASDLRAGSRRTLLIGAAASLVLAGTGWGLAGATGVAATGTGAAALPLPVGESLPQARLAGEGRLRWYGFQVYDARLFVPLEGLDPTRYARFPFALELKYARRLLGDEIARASEREVARLGYGSQAQRTSWLETMQAFFPDVSAGDRLTGVNLPDGRVAFFHNDTRIGRVEDRQFGEAFFGIWLDPRTVAPDLRRSLLQNLARTETTGAPR